MIGHSLSADTVALTAVSITNAESPEVATQISKTYSSNGGDIAQLSVELNGLQGGMSEPLSGPGQDNVDAVLKSLESETAAPVTPPRSVVSNADLANNVRGLDAINGGCTMDRQPNGSGGCVPNSAGASNGGCTGGLQPNGSGGCIPVSKTPSGDTFPTPGLDATNGGCLASMQPNGSGGCVPNSGGAANGGCPAGSEPNGSGGCIPATQAPAASCPAGQSGTPCAPTSAPSPDGCTPSLLNLFNCGNNNGGGLGNIGSLGVPFLTGLLHGMNRASAAQQYQQAAQTAAAANAPYGRGNDGYACFQPQSQPPSTSCTVGTWQQQRQSNGCPGSWSCIPNGGGSNPAVQPSAALSCQPQTADVGTTISMSYACTNATASYGSGFSTGGQPSGSVTSVITAPPYGSMSATYSLTCVNQSLTASAQCAIQINQPSIVLIANPSVVSSGASTAIGWVTTGMRACTVSSPDSASFTAVNANNQSINGVATTSPITATMHIVLNCETLNGGARQATTVVSIGTVNNDSGAVSIRSTADGGSITHGGTDRITWSTSNAPSGSAISLWLVNMQTHKTQAVIAGGLAPNGVYTWNIPALGASCNANASNVCASDIVNGATYSIEAVLYTPGNAYIGDGTAPASPTQPTYGNSGVTQSFTVHD